MSKFSRISKRSVGLDDLSIDLSETTKPIAKADPRTAPAQWLCEKALQPLSDVAAQHERTGRRICAIVKLDSEWVDAAGAATTSLLGQNLEIRTAQDLRSHRANSASILRRLSWL